MAAVTTYPTDWKDRDNWIIRGDPVAIPVGIVDPENVTPLDERTWRAHIRKSEDAKLVVAFTVDVNDAGDGLILRLTAEQSRLLTEGMVFDVEEVGVRTWWKVTKMGVLKDVSHD